MKRITWEQAKVLASKKIKVKNESYWKLVTSLYETAFPMLGGGTSEDVTDQLADEARKQGVQNPEEVAKSATELASHKMPSGVDTASPEYAPMLKGVASQYVGVQNNSSNPSVSDPTANNSSMFSNSIFEKQMKEDNYYNRASVVVQQTGSDITIVNKDKFDFSLSSNKLNATAIALENGATFEIKLRVITKSSPMWTANWKQLENKGVENVLRVTIDGLSINSQYMSAEDDRQFSSAYNSSLSKTISKVIETYNKLWGKSHYQIIVLCTNLESKAPLITMCADEIKKLSGLSISNPITEILNQTNTAEWRKSFWVALKNSSGKSFKEDVTSDAFIDVVPENATVIGQTSGIINGKASKNNRKMKKYGFSAQLEAVNPYTHTEEPEDKESDQERTYYLMLPDGTVGAFDSKQKRDFFKEKYPEAVTIRAHDFFNMIINNEDSFNIHDMVFFNDIGVPISVNSDSEKVRRTGVGVKGSVVGE